MIINILQKNKIRKVILPEKIYGVYSILTDDGKMLVNIEAINGKWILKNNEYVELAIDGKTTGDIELINYFKYVIKERITSESIEIMPTPSYEKNTKLLTTKKQIVVGNDDNCDIIYNNSVFNNKKIIFDKVNNHWTVTQELCGAYICDRTFKKRNMFHGDWIFADGLKIIVINDIFIINNPKNMVTLKNGSFELYKDIKQTITYQTGISEDKLLYDKDDFFYKAPRFKSDCEEIEIKISAPKPESEDHQNPTILQIGPRLTMSIMSFYTLFSTLQQYMAGETSFSRIIPSLIMVIVMLLSSILWPSLTRKYQQRRRKKERLIRMKKYTRYLDKKEQIIKERLSFEKQVLIENNTPLEECQSIIYNKKRNLWERKITDSDFLSIRIGTGNVRSKISIIGPDDEDFTEEEETLLKKRYDEIIDSSKYVLDAPMDVSLTQHQIVAVVGNPILTKYFFDSVFLQLTTFHSYRDLKIFVITNKENDFLWDYMRIMPHCWDNLKTTRYFSNNSKDMNEISNGLTSIFQARLAAISKGKNSENAEEVVSDGGNAVKEFHNFETYYLLFIDDLEQARNVPIIKQILKYKINLGFSVIIRNNKLSNLPSECTTFIDVESDVSGLFESELKQDNQKQFKAELNKTIDMYGCALQLANIPIQAEKAKFELPSSISFLSMYNVGKVEQLNSLDRWKKNNPVNSLGVPVGINQDGELFMMDAHEKGWGPHGLVAGTTGSGKSEWIITYILSLAVNFHPDEVQFVLIDYKGGGLALSFENKSLGIKLPHLAGTITNLDKSTINRALTSIEAELKARQRKFNEAREKLHESSMDIYKYQSFYRKGMLDEPISHLFLISDEFAELKSQEPEFLSQLVSTARIGRSLGVHLILATQKPSGVVNEQIWSNSRFHVCLRVQDKGDSQSMIKTPDAAMLKQTGAFYLQVGYNEYYALGQSAYSGAKYYPSDIVKKKIDDSIQYIDNLGNTINNYIKEDPSTQNIKQQGEELLNVVSYLSTLGKQEKMFCKQLWLPNVPTEIYLHEIKKRYEWKPIRFSLLTAIGEYDNPSLQTQGLFAIDLSKNTAIYGESGSGKENLLATLIWSSITEHTPEEVNFYIFDFGAETLRMFSKYPHVGEIVYQGENDRVAGVIQMIVDELAKRKEMFADYNGNYESYIKESGKFLPRWIVIINAWDVFNETIPKLGAYLDTLFRDCTKYGISFICATTASSVLKGRRVQFFENKLLMHMQNDSDYRDITNCSKNLIPQNSFGRGIGPLIENYYCEFQTAFITRREEINSIVRKNATTFASYYKTSAKSLPKIPENVTSDELAKYITDISAVPVGYNFQDKDLAKFNFIKEKIYTICLDEIKNHMKSIYGLINIISKVPGTKVRVYDLGGLYEGSNLDIQVWRENFDAVLLALKDNMVKRTLQQDHGVNFILGAGLLKTKLSTEGKEILSQYMDAIDSSVNTTTILVDSYARIKTLKIEPWFARIDTSFGIWIGSGIDSQNLLNVKELTMEERKLNYEGMAYLIDNSDYITIKTILDEE